MLNGQSLIMQESEKCQIMDWKTVGDGSGGFDTVLTPGAEFRATITRENDRLAVIAQAITQQTDFKVYTSRAVPLKEKTVFKRLSDGQLFECIFDNDKQTPKSAGLDIRVTTARIWSGKKEAAE